MRRVTQYLFFLTADCLVGLVIKASALRAADPGFGSRLCSEYFSGSSHTSDLKIGTPVVTLPGDQHCRVSVGLVSLVSAYCDRVR